MSSELAIPQRHSRRGEPVWEILDILPWQGAWSEADYLALETKKLVEFTDGMIEVLPMPTVFHQVITVWLCNLLNGLHVDRERLGFAVTAPFKLRLRGGKYREPDVLVLKRKNLERLDNQLWDYADFVIEIVSPGGEKRDYDEKVLDYAEAGVPEYWVVDPQKRAIVQYVLHDGKYADGHAVSGAVTLQAATLPGFEVNVENVFVQAERAMKLES